MKRGVIALVMILTALAVSGAEAAVTVTGTQTCVEMLEEAEQHMERNEIAEAQSLAARLENRYGKLAGSYDLFLYHSEVLKVTAELGALRRYAQTGSTAEFLACAERIKASLLSIRSTGTPSWENLL